MNLLLFIGLMFAGEAYQSKVILPVLQNSQLHLIDERPNKSRFKIDPEDQKEWQKRAQQKKKGPPKEVVEMWKKRAEEMQAKPQKPKHKAPSYGPLYFDTPYRWSPRNFHYMPPRVRTHKYGPPRHWPPVDVRPRRTWYLNIGLHNLYT